MSLEVSNLNLADVSTFDEALPQILDPDFTDIITFGVKANTDAYIYSVTRTESAIAERLGVKPDEYGFFPGVITSSSVLRGLENAYGSKCSTKPEILIASLVLDKEGFVDAELIMPLRAPLLQHKAARIAVMYSVGLRKPKGLDERKHLIRKANQSKAKIIENPFYDPPTKKDCHLGDIYSRHITLNAAFKGTLGTS